jgi:hypothetical protein
MGGAYNMYGIDENAYIILVGKSKGIRPLGRPRRKLGSNIKIDLE